MYVCFVALETIIHPETRQILIRKGQVYGQEQILRIAGDIGMDNVALRMCIGNTLKEMIECSSRFIS